MDVNQWYSQVLGQYSKNFVICKALLLKKIFFSKMIVKKIDKSRILS